MTKKVGDIVYSFDYNRRVYAKDENGKSFGGPIYAEHFRPYKIVREEGKSFYLSPIDDSGKVWNMEEKVGKSVINRYYSEQEKADKIFMEDNRHVAAEKVRYVGIDKLKRIVAILEEK